MKLKELNNPISVLFKITSRCNKKCVFCSEIPFIENKRACLGYNEVINNFDYLRKRFNINSYILSGGEPTLHSEYFSILDFFSKQNVTLKIITNLSKFNDNDFLKKHNKFFHKGRDWIILGSINNLPLEETDSNIAGLKNILTSKFPISLIILAYKNNLKELPELLKYLEKLYSISRTSLKAELRLVYINDVCNRVMKAAPNDFKALSYCFSECMRIASHINMSLTMWNFPICYLNKIYHNLDPYIEKRKNVQVIKIDKDNQFGNYKLRDFRLFFYKSDECKFCKFFNACSGINIKYINDFNFPRLKLVCHQYV